MYFDFRSLFSVSAKMAFCSEHGSDGLLRHFEWGPSQRNLDWETRRMHAIRGTCGIFVFPLSFTFRTDLERSILIK